MPETSPNPRQLARRARDLARLVQADQAPRCVHVKSNGLRCGSPAMRGEPWCFFHDRWLNRPADDCFPPLEDANSVQFSLMQVIERLRREALRPGSLDPRLVKPLIFALKVAGQNARHTSFDGAGFRSQFVTELPRAEISAPEAVPAAKNGARKLPSSARTAGLVEGPESAAGSASGGSPRL